jgi:sugar-specific transcriptional regulator TrmB
LTDKSYAEEEIQTLMGLGLTSSQAKILHFLFYSGMSTAKVISKATGINRPDIYRIMPNLHEKGLIKKIVSVPVKFEAVSIEDALTYLIEHRTSETNVLKIKAADIIKNYKDKKHYKVARKDESQFVIIPKGKAIIKKRRNAIENAKESIDAIISYSRYLPTMIDNSEMILKALNRGVKIRHITELPQDIKTLPKLTQEIWRHPSFEVRIVTKPLTSLVAIYDKKEVIVSISPALTYSKSDAFWSDNRSMLEIIQEFFESTWNGAQKKS